MTIEIDLDALERAAKAATPGEWEQHPLHKTAVRHPVFECWIPQTAEDAAFIAAANPAVVLELVRRLREAEKDAGRYRHMRASATFQNRNGPGVYWYLPRWDRQLEIGERLDRAIDSAMGEPK